ncbi:hypothetical protein E4U43_007520 [Claviceps pusilla]|uniref:Uncharacterized protein n=1 Tax=Claviceps pusilla TaxID=123648 RepID=A0A9P7NCH1_9HYPO|nr:hypothetical protein E4U43_007520 [Claviceps pusilla]
MRSTLYWASLLGSISSVVASPRHRQDHHHRLLNASSSVPGCPAHMKPTPLPSGYNPNHHHHSNCTTTPPPGPTQPAPTRSACPITNTVTHLLGKHEGCGFDPSTELCINDGILTLPCGCGHATVTTTTTSVCATADGQQACHLGYMYTTTATNCPTPTAHPKHHKHHQ